MDNNTLEELKVVITATVEPLIKEIERAKTSIRSLSQERVKIVIGEDATKQANVVQRAIQRTRDVIRRTTKQQNDDINKSAKQIRLENSFDATQRKAESLKLKMQELANTRIPTHEYKALQKELDRSEKHMSKLLNKREMLEENGSLRRQRTSWNDLTHQIDQTEQMIKRTEQAIQNLENSNRAFTNGSATERFSNLSNQLQNTTGNLNYYSQRMHEVEDASKNGAQGFSRLASSVLSSNTKVGSLLGGLSKAVPVLGAISIAIVAVTTAVKVAVKAAQAAVKLTVETIKGINTGIKTLLTPIALFGNVVKKTFESVADRVKSVFSRIASSIKSAFVTTVFRRAFGDLRDYIGNVIMSNNQLSASLAQVKGNLITAFQPIYEAILPALQTFANALAKVTGYIAQFTSLLFGKNVNQEQKNAQNLYNRAKAMDETGKSAKKAKDKVKELNKELGKYDELMVIAKNDGNDTDSNLADTGADTNDGIVPTFTPIVPSQSITDFYNNLKEALKSGDLSGAGSIVATKLNNALSSINWKEIKSTAKTIASDIATFLNGFIGTTNWKLVGTTVAECLNTAVAFAETLTWKFKWGSLGTAVANIVNGFVSTANWSGIGKTIVNCINGSVKALTNFFDKTNFKLLASSLASTVNVAISDTDWSGILKAVAKGINSYITTVRTLSQNIKWGELGTKVGESINDFFAETDWVSAGKSVNEFSTAMYNLITKALDAINWTQVGIDVGTFIGTIDFTKMGLQIAIALGKAISGLAKAGMTAYISAGIVSFLKAGVMSGIINTANGKDEYDIEANTSGSKSGNTVGYESLKKDLNTTSSVEVKFTATKDNKFNAMLSDYSMLKNKTAKVTADADQKQNFKDTKNSIDGIKSKTATVTAKGSQYQNFKDTRNAINNVKSKTATVTAKGSQYQNFKDVLSGIKKAVTKTIKITATGSQTETFKNLWSRLKGVISGTVQIVANAGKNAITGLKNWWSSFAHCATGTVVPANHGDTPVIVGDNKREVEVISPLSTMKQAFAQSLRENNFSGGNNTNASGDIIVQIDGREVFRATRQQAKSFYNQTGKNAFAY